MCEVSDESAPVKWLKAGEEIPEDDERYEFKVQGRRRSLVIKDTTLEDAAEYSCELPEKVKTTAPVTVEGESKYQRNSPPGKGTYQNIKIVLPCYQLHIIILPLKASSDVM